MKKGPYGYYPTREEADRSNNRIMFWYAVGVAVGATLLVMLGV